MPCSWHHESEDGLLTVWPAVYHQWASNHGLVESPGVPSVRLPPSRDALRRTAEALAEAGQADRPGAGARFSIANPPAGAVYLIDPTLRREYQALPLRATADAHAGTIEWAVDGRRLGASHADEALQWPLASGAHRISARDERGRVAEVNILVK